MGHLGQALGLATCVYENPLILPQFWRQVLGQLLSGHRATSKLLLDISIHGQSCQ